MIILKDIYYLKIHFKTPESRVMAGVELFTLVLVYCITIVSASLISNKVRSDGICSTSNVAFRRTLSTVNAFTFIVSFEISFMPLKFLLKLNQVTPDFMFI